MKKVIIAGSRDFNNYEHLKEKCDYWLNFHSIINPEIVSGTANGADKLGERYASERGYKVTKFPADWSLGKKAGYERNFEMAKYSDVLIAFWDGRSKGTYHMINLGIQLGLIVIIEKYNNNES